MFSEIIDWNQISFPPNPYRLAGALFDYFTTGPLVPMDITCIGQSMIAPLISVLTTKIELEGIDKEERNE